MAEASEAASVEVASAEVRAVVALVADHVAVVAVADADDSPTYAIETQTDTFNPILGESYETH